MKLLIFSDTHGHGNAMLTAIAHNQPDLIVHLGDGGAELGQIEKQFPQVPLKAVRGNCDFSSRLPEAVFFTAGKAKIFMTHGHVYGVKCGLQPLVEEGRARDADLVLFGHTHRPLSTTHSGLTLINPGSCSGATPSYAELTIDEHGEILCHIVGV